MRIYRVLLLGLVLVALSTPRLGHAQEDTGLSAQEQEWLAYVQGAFDKLAGMTSFTVQAQQTTTQLMSSPDIGLDEVRTSVQQDITTDTVLGADGLITASSSVVDTSNEVTGLLGMDFTQTTQMEIILIGDTYYLSVPVYEDSFGTRNPYPRGWVNLSDDPQYMTQGYDLEGMANYSQRFLPFGELTDLIIRHVSEQPIFENGDQQLRVFVLEYDMQGVVENGLEELAGIYSEDALSGTGMDAQELLEKLFEGAVMYHTIWIGVDDQLPYRLKSELRIDSAIDDPASGASISLLQTTRTSSVLSNFNVPVTIEAPIAD